MKTFMVTVDGHERQVKAEPDTPLSRTLIEEVKWDASCVTSVDWASYRAFAPRRLRPSG